MPTVHVMSRTGTAIGPLSPARIESVEWVMHGVSQATIRCPTTATGWGDLFPASPSDWREIQIRTDGGSPLWDGVPVEVEIGSDGLATIQCAGIEHYLTRTIIGNYAGRTNLLTSEPSFEGGLGSWANVGLVSATSVNDWPTSSPHAGPWAIRQGSRVAKLVHNVSGADAFIDQSFTFTSGSIGNSITVSGWAFIDSMTFPAYGLRGLLIEYGPPSPFTVEDYAYSTIDLFTPRGQWVRQEAQVWVPPSRTVIVRVRCYGINGTIYWDDIQCVLDESLTVTGHVTSAVGSLVSHAQNTTMGHVARGMTSTIKRGYTGSAYDEKFVWKYDRHVTVWDALQELRGSGRLLVSFLPGRVVQAEGTYGSFFDAAFTLQNGTHIKDWRLIRRLPTEQWTMVHPAGGSGPAQTEIGFASYLYATSLGTEDVLFASGDASLWGMDLQLNTLAAREQAPTTVDLVLVSAGSLNIQTEIASGNWYPGVCVEVTGTGNSDIDMDGWQIVSHVWEPEPDVHRIRLQWAN